MNIIVPIKQVPETNAVRMDEATGTMIREGVVSIINPLDLYGIELAIQLRDRFGGRATGISMGPAKAAEALREAIAMGLDDGILLSDRAFAGADTWATAYALSRGIAKIGEYDLIICGERATDGDTGQVGPAIAAFLDMPVASYISKFMDADAGHLRVHRLVEDGYEMLEVDLPCVLTVVKEVSNPRLPTLRGKQKARKAEIVVWGAGDVGADASLVGLKGSPTRVVKIHRPKVSRKCEKVVAADDASTEAAVAGLVALLEKRELI